MKSRLVVVVVMLGAFILGYAAGGSGLHAQASSVPFPFSQGDTVQLGVTGGGSRTCVVEGFANGWVICKGDRTITYNLANVISVTVTERELR